MRRLVRRQEREWDAMAPDERRASQSRTAREAREFARATRGKRRRVGRWTRRPADIPATAIHAAVLPTGALIFWGYPPTGFPNEGRAAIWNPRDGNHAGAYREVPPPVIDPDGNGPQGAGPAPIYCSGQSLLPSGRLLVTGGNRTWPDGADLQSYTGLRETFTFYPWSESWAQGPDMAAGRWYPGQVPIGDGRTVLLGGYDDDAPGGTRNPRLETVTEHGTGPSDLEIAIEAGAERSVEPYPNLFSLPDGDVLMAGADIADAAILDANGSGQGDMSWRDLPFNSFHRVGGTAVLEPSKARGSWRAIQTGGYSPPYEGFRPASRSAEAINARAGSPRWKRHRSLVRGRSYHNMVVLPDRSMVAIGGASGFSSEAGNYETSGSLQRRRVEILDPARKRWILGPAQLEDRTYHSVAILLPDGRVWSAGDDVHGPLQDNGTSYQDTAEIYSPPYLFRGKRPRLGSVPGVLAHGDRFEVRARRGGARIGSAALVAPGAVTHSNDNQQRVIELRKRARSSGRRAALRVPRRAGAAPPGYYMLFGMSRRGVPSVAKWIRIGG